MWLDRRPILRLLIASLVVHACVLGGVHARTGGIDGYAFSSLDSREYYTIARNVADHGTFSQTAGVPPEARPPVNADRQAAPGTRALEPDTWRTPGYPLFLALVMLILGKSPLMLVVVQQVLAVVNVLLLFQIARKFMGDRRATVAAGLCLCEPYHLFYSTWLMSTTLFVTVLMLTWYAWQRARERSLWRWFACLGLSCSVLVLVRPVGALVPIILLGWLIGMLWSRQRSTSSLDRESLLGRPAGAEEGFSADQKGSPRGRTRWQCTVVFAVAVVVPCGAWMLRNQVVAGHFALSDQGGVVLAYFKATEVVLWQQGRAADRYVETSLDLTKADLPHTVWDEIDERLRTRMVGVTDEQRTSLNWANLAQGNKTSVDSFEISRALARIGWSYLFDAPVSTAACYLGRCGSILTFPLNLAVQPAEGVEARRVSCVLKALPYLLLCAAVLLRMVRRRPAYGEILFPLMCTVALLLASTPQIDPRFRVPIIPMLIFIALAPKRSP